MGKIPVLWCILGAVSNTMTGESLGTLLLRLMDERGLSQSRFAALVGVNRVTVHAWVNEGMVPQPENRGRIADVLRVPQRVIDEAAAATEREKWERRSGSLEPRPVDRSGESALDTSLAGALAELDPEAQRLLAAFILRVRGGGSLLPEMRARLQQQLGDTEPRPGA